ncbi:hypothetical protein BD413DRAFT_163630 [Trametes elegans]|nr:hypothetical protein BD413DRAFT_163630 [Trametes elegans]
MDVQHADVQTSVANVFDSPAASAERSSPLTACLVLRSNHTLWVRTHLYWIPWLLTTLATGCGPFNHISRPILTHASSVPDLRLIARMVLVRTTVPSPLQPLVLRSQRNVRPDTSCSSNAPTTTEMPAYDTVPSTPSRAGDSLCERRSSQRHCPRSRPSTRPSLHAESMLEHIGAADREYCRVHHHGPCCHALISGARPLFSPSPRRS